MSSPSVLALEPLISALKTPFFPAPLRRSALARFASAGFPSTDQPGWRHTDVSALAARPLLASRAATPPVSVPAAYALPGASARLVFVNGYFAPALSNAGGLAAGVEAGPLSSRPEAPPLGALLPLEGAPFAALNTALFPDGAYVRVTRGAAAEAPIHLLFLTLPVGAPAHVFPRTLIVMEEASQALVVEEHAGGGADLAAEAVTEISCGPSSRLTHVRLVRDLAGGFHLGHVHARQDRAAVYSSHNVVFGGGLTRNQFTSVLEGEGAETSFDGLALARGRETVDNHTTLDHAAPHGTSRENYKYLLADRSRGVFNGEVVIRPGAQKADTAQSNANLLLSDQALMHTTPELRIFADDVKAKHGATIGQLNKDMLFYCRSRGLSLEDAKRLLTQAFAVEVLERLPFEPLRNAVLDAVASWWGAPEENPS
jgi:Fe-S cluster assembly protein SufD